MINISEQSLRDAIRPFLSYIPSVKEDDNEEYLNIIVAVIKLNSLSDVVGNLLEDYHESNS